MPLTAWTNYCFNFLGDKPYSAGSAPVRKCKIAGYDGDKRLLIEIEGVTTSAHRAYVNSSKRKLKRFKSMKRSTIIRLLSRHKLKNAYHDWFEDVRIYVNPCPNDQIK